MDFRDWKKVSEDNKTCILQHPKGHKLTVILKGLSSIHREQIKKLKMADGGKVRKYADGTPEGTVQGDDQQNSDTTQSSGDGHTTNVYVSSAPPAAPTAVPVPVATPIASPVAQPMPSMSQAVNPAAQLAKAPLPVQVPAPMEGESNLNPNGQPNPSAISKNAQLIPEAQKNIDTAQAQAEGQNLQELNKSEGDTIQQFQNRYNDMAKHVDDFSNYMQKNPIDPKHYEESRSTGAKVSSAIGLFFGGLSVPFGGHNYAMDYLNKQIDRDIEAQKSRADQQKTVYGAYKDLYGEGKEALAATKATMLDIFNNRQKMIAAQLGTPQAAAKSLALGNHLAIEKQKALKEGAAPLNVLPGFNPGKAKNSGTPGAGPGAPPMSNKAKGTKPQAAAARDTILVPGSEKMLANLKYNPLASEMMPAIMEQHAKADLADKALQTIDQVFPNLAKETSEAGYARSKLEPALGSLPFIGGTLARASNAFTDTPANRNYDSDKSLVKGAIRGALQGNVSDDLLDSVLESNLPQLGEKNQPALTKKKIDALKDFIKSHTRTDLLRQFNLSKK